MKAREGKLGPHCADTEKQLKPLAACRRLSEQPPKVSLEATLNTQPHRVRNLKYYFCINFQETLIFLSLSFLTSFALNKYVVF